jgi:PPOX class probable F420-dependent enzyme
MGRLSGWVDARRRDHGSACGRADSLGCIGQTAAMTPRPPWFDTARYLSLATLRKDGREVRTPVWFACDGDSLVLFSAGDAGKVKRVRRTGAGRVAACDVRGGLLDARQGAAESAASWVDVEAVLLSSPDEIARAHRAVRQKYGLQMWLLDLGSRLAGRVASRAWIRLRLR